MKHNLRWFKFFTILVLLAFTASFTPRIAKAQRGNPPSATPSPTVVVTVEKNHVFEDKDWPIIRTETQQIKDPDTGEIHTITITIRKAPKDAVPPSSNGCAIKNTSTTTNIAASGCTYLGQYSDDGEDVRLGGVVSHAKHYYYRYCYNSLCDVYQPYKLVEWWTRSDANWTVQNAYTHWGSDGSWLRCTTDTYYSYIYADGPFTPSWNGNTSVYHIFNGNWPQMQPTVEYPLTATIASDGYYYDSYDGSMGVAFTYYP